MARSNLNVLPLPQQPSKPATASQLAAPPRMARSNLSLRKTPPDDGPRNSSPRKWLQFRRPQPSRDGEVDPEYT
eukprot:1366569-Pyramimonas_sp.AAC.1